ncbi:MAG: AAA family ATPase [Ktedonobacteraceae bacterium]|nr:AAA family ATPase [Ktedonobacteraceae bacterium]
MRVPFADPLIRLEQSATSLPLFGREAEQQVMRVLLNTIASGSRDGEGARQGAQALMLSGEMGTGKTRLLAFLYREARERGFRVLDSAAYEASRLFPYFLFIEALRPLLRTATTEQFRRYLGLDTATTSEAYTRDNGVITFTNQQMVASLSRVFPELSVRFPTAGQRHEQDESKVEILSPEQEKFRLFDAIATLLERVAQEQPVLLSVDNLQWADSASLELMLYLIVRLRDSRVELVGATRPPSTGRDAEQAPEEAAAKALGELIRQGLLLLLPLGPLDEDAAARYLQALLPGSHSEGLVPALLERAEGNPFFLEELVRTLATNQQLVVHEGTWHLVRPDSIKLPASIHLAVRQRLQELSARCRSLLHTAALFGRRFPVEALAQVVGKQPEEVQLLIDEAIQAAVIVSLPDTTEYVHSNEAGNFPLEELPQPAAFSTPRPALQFYTFCQGIVQESLEADVPSHQARVLHAAIGKALETCYASEAHAHAAELARHYAASDEQEATVYWSLLAGEDAIRQQAQREAIKHFSLALNLLATMEREGRAPAIQAPSLAELSLTIGDLWSRLGVLEQAINAFQQALENLQHHMGASPFLLARANRMLADAYRMLARYDQAKAHLQAAGMAFDEMLAAQGEKEESGRESGEFYRRISYPSWFPGRSFALAQSPSLLVRVNQAERILFLQSQAVLFIMLNRPAEAEEALWHSHQIATAIGDRGSQAFALHMIGWILGWGERTNEALRLLDQAHDLYLAIGDPFRAALGDQSLGSIYQVLGEMERARLYTLRGMERARRYGVYRISGLLHWNQGTMALIQGDWQGCASHLQQALHQASIHNDARLKALIIQAQAELQFRRGNWQEAEQIFLEGIGSGLATEWHAGIAALYGHFLAVTGRTSLALEQLERAASLPEPPGFSGHFYLPFLAEGFLHLNKLEQVQTYLERVRHLRGFIYYGTSVDRILGVIAAHMRDWTTAEQCFEAGLLLCRRAGNRPEEGNIYYEQARMELARGTSLQQVGKLCEQALAIFQQYDMQRAVAMVTALREGAQQLTSSEHKGARSLPVQQPHTSSALDQILTRRELEVLRLVAEGYTDREVADLLVISTRTVNRHLSNIFIKLDVPGRAAAAAYAVRQGLVQ